MDRDPRGAEFQKELNRQMTDLGDEIRMTTEQKERIIREGMDIELMAASPGWKVIEQWIHSRLDITQNFITAPPEKLYALQQETKAYVGVLKEIQARIEIKNRFQQQIEEAERRKNEQKEDQS